MKQLFAPTLAGLLALAPSPLRAQGTAFTYQGRLTDSGQPAQGQYEMVFTVWTASSGGFPLGRIITNSLAISNGVFSTSLDFGPGIFDGSPRWLEIGVRTNGSPGLFLGLTPRQPISPSPYAIFAQSVAWTNIAAVNTGPGLLLGAGNAVSVNFAGSGASTAAARSDHHHFAQSWSGAANAGLTITNTGSGSAPAGLVAEASATNGFGLIGRQGNGSGYLPRPGGVVGNGDNQPGVTAASRTAPGVLADSYGSDAILGIAFGTNDAYSGVAGISYAPGGQGVFGQANVSWGLSSGVYGETLSTNGAGVWGEASVATGDADGVFGRTFSPAGRGVYGLSLAASGDGLGVYGVSSSPTGVGVRGEGGVGGVEGVASASGGVGVFGVGETGMFAESGDADGTGLVGRANNGASAYGIWGISGSGYAGYFSGKVHVQGALTKQSGAFKIDHPLDPQNKWLYHSFVESPDMKNIYDGVVALDAQGRAVVELPAWFGALNRDFRYQLTALGGPAPNLHVASEIQNNRFTIGGGAAGQRVSWQVTGIRQDAYAAQNPIPVEQEKTAAEKAAFSEGQKAALAAGQSLGPKQPPPSRRR